MVIKFPVYLFCILMIMNVSTKIHLSKDEQELIENKEWILTKHAVINKVCLLFSEMHEVYKQIATGNNMTSLFNNITNGKISKGENYIQLPYVILDYPALFSKEKVFAIRTLFWWGNFFSVSLHLSGKDFQLNKDFAGLKDFLKEKDFFICVNENEWQHHFEPSNYLPVKEVDDIYFRKILKKNFLKISKKIELSKWNEAPEFLEKVFSEIITFLKISFPGDEKVLSPVFPKAVTDL